MQELRQRGSYKNEDDKRICITVRLPRQKVDRLRKQRGSMGRIVEKALDLYFLTLNKSEGK